MKKLYKFALTCAIIVATSISVSAQVATNGNIGMPKKAGDPITDDVTWKYDNTSNTLTLEGEGHIIRLYGINQQPWASFQDDIRTIIIGEGIKFMGQYLFASFSNIDTVVIASSVTEWGNNMFSNAGLSTLTCKAVTPPKIPPYNTNFESISTTIPIYIPIESKESYKTAIGWDYFSNFLGYDCKLTVEANDSNLGSVSNNSGEYIEGNKVEISATPAKYCVFTEWSDGNTENPRIVTITGNTTLTAIFSYDDFTSNLMSKITTLQSDSTNLQKLLKTANDTIVKLRADSTNLQKQLGTANASILTLQSDTASLKSQIKTLNEEKTTLTSQNETLQSEKQTATTNFNECNDKVSGLENKNTLLTTQVNDLQTQLTNCKSTDIPTIKSTDALRIYPNPAQDFITIEGVIQAEIAVIYDIAGRAMQTAALHVGSNTVNIAMLPNGTYRIVINGNSGTFMKE